jgi:large subunit ribosomal protein L24
VKKKTVAVDSTKTRLRKNDQVVVTTGKDRGKSGRVLSIDRVAGRVVVEGLNMVKKAVKKKKQTDKGGITDVEAAIHISNVQIAGKSGKPDRIGYRVEGDKKVRIRKKTGDTL